MLRLAQQNRLLIALAAPLFAAACASVDTNLGAAQPTDVPPAPAAPVYALSDVMGASAGDVDALLGPAALIRREGAGEYRRYALNECALIVILYPDETGARKAAHVDATALTSDAEKPDPEACLAAG